MKISGKQPTTVVAATTRMLTKISVDAGEN
jgi:hypothetical protein